MKLKNLAKKCKELKEFGQKLQEIKIIREFLGMSKILTTGPGSLDTCVERSKGRLNTIVHNINHYPTPFIVDKFDIR